jgi:hypothetical protein
MNIQFDGAELGLVHIKGHAFVLKNSQFAP